MAIDFIEIRLPAPKDLGKFALWAVGRAGFSLWLFSLQLLKSGCKLLIWLADMTETASKHVLTPYNQLPYKGTLAAAIEVPVLSSSNELNNIITDIIGYIEGEDKPLMILGEMGSGKSTIAQYIAYAYGGKVKVFEPEGTPDDWIGLEVVGKGENWTAIDDSMVSDLEDLTAQLQLRTEKGDRALAGSEKVLIAEEYPEIRAKCEHADEWFERHARRGRKARRFVIALSQYDRVAAWGLEGKSDLGDAFLRLRLGKKAVLHAKSLKNGQLIEWLRQDRSHCLLDDQPCKLPSYREMKAVTLRSVSQLPIAKQDKAETTAERAFQPIKPSTIDLSNAEIAAVKACIACGVSDSRIIKEVLNYSGGRYQQGKELLELIKNN